MHDPITIFLIVLGWFSVDLFLVLCFLERKVPLAFFARLVCWCCILLTFACLEIFWFLYQIWMRVLLGRVFLPVGSSFNHFNILSLSLIFVSLITMCLSVFFLRFIMTGALCASWTWLTISFSMLGKISAITSSYIYSCPLSLVFFFWDSYNANVGTLNVVPVVS